VKIAFTICSNNYLAQARILITTLLEHNPDYKFILGLVDKKSLLLDYNFDNRLEVIEVDELDLNEHYDIYAKYNIIELNTSVKPSYFKRIKQLHPKAALIIYLDPDIAIFGKLSEIEIAAETKSILLTPHILTPIDLDEHEPSENTFLNYGIYNLGFIALAFWDKQVYAMLDWWEQRTLSLGFDRVCDGIFVDQLWINLVPVYYENVKIICNPGVNMAPWNLHERKLSKDSNGKYKVNINFDLIFYHFSNYSYSQPDLISKYYNRYSFQNHSDLLSLYAWYQAGLIDNNIDQLSKIECIYIRKDETIIKEAGTFKKIKNAFKVLTPPLLWKVIKKVISK
jgi:hypothetical protein